MVKDYEVANYTIHGGRSTGMHITLQAKERNKNNDPELIRSSAIWSETSTAAATYVDTIFVKRGR